MIERDVSNGNLIVSWLVAPLEQHHRFDILVDAASTPGEKEAAPDGD